MDASLESDTVSGRLLSQISDHFPQFLVINLGAAKRRG